MRIGIAACYAIFDQANVRWSISGSCRSSSIPRLIDECTLWNMYVLHKFGGCSRNTMHIILLLFFFCFFFFFFRFGVAPFWDLCHVNDASLTNAKHNSFHSEGHYISSIQPFAICRWSLSDKCPSAILMNSRSNQADVEVWFILKGFSKQQNCLK